MSGPPGPNADPEAALAALSDEEDQLRRELAEARRLLRVERTASRPPKVRFGLVDVAICVFLASLATSGCLRCLGVGT
jgi:hypothetical protein